MKNLIILLCFLSITGYGQDSIPELPSTGCGTELLDFNENRMERQLDRSVRKMSRMEVEADEPGNFKLVYHIVTDGKDYSNFFSGWIPYSQAESSAKSLHEVFRNQGKHYKADWMDTGISFCLDTVIYYDGTEVWGNNFKQYGVAVNGTNGVDPRAIYSYVKNGYKNDPTVYHIVSVPRITSTTSSGVVGFAWMAQSALNNLAGQFTVFRNIGHSDDDDGTFRYSGTSINNATVCHEAGHSLSLFHSFQGMSCEPEINPLIQGDRVPGTPPHTQSGTCGIPYDQQPHINWMAYGPHVRKTSFTRDQFTLRMNPAISNYFPAVYTNEGCNWDNEPNPPVDPPVDPPIPPDPPVEPYEWVFDELSSVKAIYSFRKETQNYTSTVVTVRRDSDDMPMDLYYSECSSTLDLGCFSEYAQGEKILIQTLHDVSGNGLNAVSTVKSQMPELRIDEYGQPHIWFDDKDDRLTVTGLEHTEYTYNIVLKHNQAPSGVRAMFTKRPSVNNSHLLLFTFDSFKNHVLWDQANATGNNRFDTGFKPNANTLYSYTFSRSLTERTFYLNGNPEKSTTANVNVLNTSPLIIGNEPSQSNRGLNSSVYEIIISDKPFMSPEVLKLGQNQTEHYEK